MFGLIDGNDVTDDHGHNGEHPEKRCPLALQSGKTDHEDAQKGGKGSGFRAGAHKGSDRGRRTLIDIRGPHMERRGGDLEEKADAQQSHSGNGHRIGELIRIGERNTAQSRPD